MTLSGNLSGQGDEITREEERLLTLCETLDYMDIKVPQELTEKFNKIISHKRITAYSGHDSMNEKNMFMTVTSNKRICEICESLSHEQVYR